MTSKQDYEKLQAAQEALMTAAIKKKINETLNPVWDKLCLAAAGASITLTKSKGLDDALLKADKSEEQLRKTAAIVIFALCTGAKMTGSMSFKWTAPDFTYTVTNADFATICETPDIGLMAKALKNASSGKPISKTALYHSILAKWVFIRVWSTVDSATVNPTDANFAILKAALKNSEVLEGYKMETLAKQINVAILFFTGGEEILRYRKFGAGSYSAMVGLGAHIQAKGNAGATKFFDNRSRLNVYVSLSVNMMDWDILKKPEIKTFAEDFMKTQKKEIVVSAGMKEAGIVKVEKAVT